MENNWKSEGEGSQLLGYTPVSLDKEELYKRALIKQYQPSTVQLRTDSIMRSTAKDVVNGLPSVTAATDELAGYFKRLTEIKGQKLAIKQRQYEKKMTMEREKHELYKKKMEAETRYYL